MLGCCALVLVGPSGALAQAASPDAAGGATAAPTADVAEPSVEVQAQYHDIVARAVAEYDAQHWAEARALFLRAHELWPSARTFRTLGMTSFELRSYTRALTELQAALDDPRRPLSDEQRAQVRDLLEQTRGFVGRYRVLLTPADAVLLVDGAQRVPTSDGFVWLEVGTHELLARAPRLGELRRRLEVQGREDETVVLDLQPLPSELPSESGSPQPMSAPVAAEASSADSSRALEPRSGRLWTWIAGGTALALSGASVALWVAGDHEFDTLRKRCLPGGCVRGEVDTSSVDTLDTAHQVTLGLAVAAGAAAVVLFFVEGGQSEAAPTAVIAPNARGAGVGLTF